MPALKIEELYEPAIDFARALAFGRRGFAHGAELVNGEWRLPARAAVWCELPVRTGDRLIEVRFDATAGNGFLTCEVIDCEGLVCKLSGLGSLFEQPVRLHRALEPGQRQLVERPISGQTSILCYGAEHSNGNVLRGVALRILRGPS